MKRASAVLLTLVAGLAAGCGGEGSGADAVQASSCSRVLYGGEGKPDVIVVSDFPLRGFGAQKTRQMVRAIEYVLRQRGFRAGQHRIGYQSCNDTVGTNVFDELLCKQNARAYVSSGDVVGIIGPWNSGCAWQQLPIISRKSAGPLAMVGLTSNPGLTRTIRRGSGAALYPDGIRSYARVVPNDQGEGIAAALLVARHGARRVVVVHESPVVDDYVLGITLGFDKAASDLGVAVRRLRWNQKTHGPLAGQVAAARPDAVFFVGYPEHNGKRLVEDIRAATGPDTILIAPATFEYPSLARELGAAGEGMYVTSLHTALDRLPPAGRELLRKLGLTAADAEAIWAPEAAQATEVLLDAIGRSDGSRASVVRELYRTKVTNGILGSFSFDRLGDVHPAPVTIYRFHGGRLVTDRIVHAPATMLGG